MHGWNSQEMLTRCLLLQFWLYNYNVLYWWISFRFKLCTCFWYNMLYLCLNCKYPTHAIRIFRIESQFDGCLCSLNSNRINRKNFNIGGIISFNEIWQRVWLYIRRWRVRFTSVSIPVFFKIVFFVLLLKGTFVFSWAWPPPVHCPNFSSLQDCPFLLGDRCPTATELGRVQKPRERKSLSWIVNVSCSKGPLLCLKRKKATITFTMALEPFCRCHLCLHAVLLGGFSDARISASVKNKYMNGVNTVPVLVEDNVPMKKREWTQKGREKIKEGFSIFINCVWPITGWSVLAGK